MTATSAESATNAESRTTPASGCLPTPERKETMEEVVSNSAPTNLAYHDPKTAPTLARLERLVGHPVDAEKLRAKLDTALAAAEVAPVRALGAEPLTRDEKGYYLVSVGAGPASYDHRSELKALHLRWDPTAREWTGVVLGSDIGTLEGLGLAVEVRQRRQPREPAAPSRKRDHAKASMEAYGARGVQGRESARFSLSDSPVGVGRVLAENRRAFSALDVTAGLPDDSREDDQRVRAQAERERMGRVRAAEEALKANPGARELVYRDQVKLARFCARFSITPADICPHRDDAFPSGARCGWCRGSHGAFRPIHVGDVSEILFSPSDWLAEVRAREAACLPGSEA